MKYFFLYISLIFFSFDATTQIVVKENLSKKKSFYHDFARTNLESIGSYYIDFLGESTEKHGKWLYYDKAGELIEERNYYRGKLNGKVKGFYPNGKPRQEGYFKLDVQDSVYREWYENGKLNKEGFYFKDLPSRKWTYYYLTGKEKLIEEIIDTVTYVRSFWLPDSLHTQTVTAGNGEMVVFFTTGSDKEWYQYKNGLKHGAFEEYSPYGYKTISGSFYEGLKDSLWSYWYYTGDIEKTSTYSKGKLNGAYVYYYDNGKVNVAGQYEDGLKSGTWKWFTNKGTNDMEGNFQAGKQNGRWTYWYPTGELSYTAEYSNDLKTGTWTYLYKDGSVFKKGEFKEDKKNGKWETWYEDGTLLLSGEYKNGLEEGNWKNFWETGKLKNETTFTAGILEGKWLSFYPTGKPKLTGEYENGFKTGEWIEYFENGKPASVGNYKIIKDKSKMEDGIMKDHFVYESVKDGHWTTFSDKDFKRTEEGDYKNGEKDGLWMAYYPGGKIPAVTTNFQNGKLQGKMQELDRKGELISEVDYKDGLKHGKMKLYDKKGKVAVEREFEYGQQIIKTESNSIQFGPRGR